ncbi:FSH1-domain-containing protein [Aulographum hederae CBS 113979]|uniref:FSH1-domain-containing protein n=1 Tax=Aulographum hederae CBS 113979 TaxID=1176131 RepID=A0A6G1GSF1_9PEZI|nr:FSH1-domain-containing protein [Aulographum hederae CBS 113979]
MAPDAPTKPLRILMLHGYTQSGPMFRIKTRALEKNLSKHFPAGLELVYPTAPIHLSKADIPTWDQTSVSANASFNNDSLAAEPEEEKPDAWSWWRRKGDAEPYRYEGIEIGLGKIAEVLKEQGPFDGVIGFSQGAAAAGMLASLLEEGRREAFEKAQANGGMRYPECFEEDSGYVTDTIHPPLKFAVSYCGFGAPNPLYQAFYDPVIKTPMMHFIGSVDTVVEEKRSLLLVNACDGLETADKAKETGRLVYHPGGHYLPSSQPQYLGALVTFLKEAMAGGKQEKPEEEKAEDMDVPF